MVPWAVLDESGAPLEEGAPLASGELLPRELLQEVRIFLKRRVVEDFEQPFDGKRAAWEEAPVLGIFVEERVEMTRRGYRSVGVAISVVVFEEREVRLVVAGEGEVRCVVKPVGAEVPLELASACVAEEVLVVEDALQRTRDGDLPAAIRAAEEQFSVEVQRHL